MKSNFQQHPLEIWGGAECSVVRTANHVYDQLAATGHDGRPDDLDRFADLGLRTLRFPILWERHAGHAIDWSWADQRMEQMRVLGIRPIVGFLHHGCGPLTDGFLDSNFVEGLTAFARQVARRYPWVDAFTPINEPLTTARFSALYGIWHPCATDPAVFGRVLMRQYEAIRRSMAAIREIIPHAKLVQTEDIGKTHSTPLLSYQADWENERRWLTFDLLAGRLTREMPLWGYLRYIGVGEDELASYLDRPCVPDIAGMNHYVTSERLLDERLENYPPEYAGGNGRHAYCDVPAVRARAEGAVGPAVLLRDLWQRLLLPIAVTEVQLACTREEQVRWLHEVWSAALTVRREGADVRAVTAWALLGAYDWNSLLLHQHGVYENGAFDVRSGNPQPTALANVVRALAAGKAYSHPVLTTPGWWRRPGRLVFPAVSTPHTGHGTAVSHNTNHTTPVLLVGMGGEEGDLFARLCDQRGIATQFWDGDVLQRWDRALWERNLPHTRPWGLIVQTEDNAQNIVTELREICAAQNIAFVRFSPGNAPSHQPSEPCIAEGENTSDADSLPDFNESRAPVELAPQRDTDLATQINAVLDDLIDLATAQG